MSWKWHEIHSTNIYCTHCLVNNRCSISVKLMNKSPVITRPLSSGRPCPRKGEPWLLCRPPPPSGLHKARRGAKLHLPRVEGWRSGSACHLPWAPGDSYWGLQHLLLSARESLGVGEAEGHTATALLQSPGRSQWAGALQLLLTGSLRQPSVGPPGIATAIPCPDDPGPGLRKTWPAALPTAPWLQSCPDS